MNINNTTPIIESVLKSAKMPTKGNVAQRNLLTRNDIDTFYSFLKQESEGKQEISVDKFVGLFEKVFPGVNIKPEKIENPRISGTITAISTNKNQVKGYSFGIGALENNAINLNRDTVETIQHELSHLSESIHSPKFQAAKKSFYRKVLKDIWPKNEYDTAKIIKSQTRAQAYENIYSKFLYNREIADEEYAVFKAHFTQGGREKKEAVQNRIADLKENYEKRMKIFSPMVEDEKIILMKAHIRRLESEQKAYLSGLKYRAKYTKSLQETPEFTEIKKYLTNYKTPEETRMEYIKDVHMAFLFPEKIKMLKELFFEEVQKSRASHKAKIENKK